MRNRRRTKLSSSLTEYKINIGEHLQELQQEASVEYGTKMHTSRTKKGDLICLFILHLNQQSGQILTKEYVATMPCNVVLEYQTDHFRVHSEHTDCSSNLKFAPGDLCRLSKRRPIESCWELHKSIA